MQRRVVVKEDPAEKKFKGGDGALERSEIGRLGVILTVGFAVANGYSTMNRDRHHVKLADGVSIEKLFLFCQTHLKGSPMPGTDPISDGPVLKSMFEAAQAKGLVSLEFVPGVRFLPERKTE